MLYALGSRDSVSSPSSITYPPRGIALNAYKVSPFRFPNIFLPNPIENSFTLTLKNFATIKCPPSCISTKKPNKNINLIEDLRERCLGIFEGKEMKDLLSSNEYNKYITDEKFSKFRTDFVQKAPNGESYTDVSIRCKRFLDSLDFNDDITIGIFSHYHAIRCLFLNMFKIKPRERVFKLQIQHCTPYVIEGNNLDNLKLISHDLNDMFKK